MSITIDPLLPLLVGLAFIVLVIAAVLRYFKQPHVIAYIIAGIIIGPHGLALITDELTITRLGEFGIVLLMFFIGMEISLSRLLSNWRIAVLGNLLQVIVSVGAVWLIGSRFDWSLERIFLLGFVISLSSTAVVLKILEQWKELNTKVGQNAIGVLLIQDIAIVPMLIILTLLSGDGVSGKELSLQIIGGTIIMSVMIWILIKKSIQLPFSKLLRSDHEIQVFSALLICFGLALLTGMTGISTALGAFVGGILVSAARETKWVHESLHPFQVIFVALFFISIGMLIDLTFLMDHFIPLLLLMFAVFLTNTFINAGTFKVLGETWKESIYGGAILSQIGEFSFLLAAVRLQSAIITQFAYQATISIISLTLLFSPLWILVIKKTLKINGN